MRLWIAAIFLLLNVAGSTLATQLMADALSPALKEAPVAWFGRTPVYAPWRWLFWSLELGDHAPIGVSRASLVGYGSIALSMLLVLITKLRAPRSVAPSTAYGSARWAEREDLRDAGLLGTEGVILCQTTDARYRRVIQPNTIAWKMRRPGKLLCHNGPEHVFCFAPTRSGKGAGLVVPTLLTWRHSVLVYDIKKELWAATAGWRRKFSQCWRFEPTSSTSVRFNPLFEVRRGELEVRDAQNIADILVDPEGITERRDHWQKTAHSLLVAAILHVLYAEKRKSLAGVAELLSDPSSTQIEILTRMMNTPHLGADPHPAIAGTAREMRNKSENELSGVFSTALACLGLYRDPVVACNTDSSDFEIKQLMGSANPVSLYIVVPPSDIDRLRPLVRLVLNQIGRRLTEQMDFPSERPTHRLLFLLDEFPSLGRLQFFETELAYLAGYGIKCVLIAQSLSQIEKAYGPNNSILDNAHVRLTYGALDERTAKRISDLLGQATQSRKHLSHGGKPGAFFFDHVTESQQEFARPLLTPGEVLQLPFDEALLIVGGLPPYRAKKILYFDDARFRRRAWLPTPDSHLEQTAELIARNSGGEWPIATARVPSTTPMTGVESHEEADRALEDEGMDRDEPHRGPGGDLPL